MTPARAIALLAIPLAAVIAACAPPAVVVAPVDQSIAAASTPPPPVRLRWRGANLSGGEFGSAVPGVYGRDYVYPLEAVDFFAERGMNHARVPFMHERLQPKLRGPIDEAEWSRLRAMIDRAAAKGMAVAIEPHNSWRHPARGRVISEVEAGDFWGRVAQRIRDVPGAQINLTNEPRDMPTEQVVALSAAALREIRRVGFAGLVLVPGNAFTGAWHWHSRWYGTPNAKAMLGIVDANMAFEVHQYADIDGSGSYASGDCVSPSILEERLAPFVSWLRQNGRVGFLGEIAAPNTPTCREAVRRAYESIEVNYDVWLGVDWWGAGAWRFATAEYKLSIGPTPPGQPEHPQLTWLKPFLSRPCGR